MAAKGKPKTASQDLLQRPGERDFLFEVLAGLDDLPPALGARLEELIDQPEDRAGAIRDLIEELSDE